MNVDNTAKFKVGDKVRVTFGQFIDKVGVVDRMLCDNMITVKLENSQKITFSCKVLKLIEPDNNHEYGEDFQFGTGYKPSPKFKVGDGVRYEPDEWEFYGGVVEFTVHENPKRIGDTWGYARNKRDDNGEIVYYNEQYLELIEPTFKYEVGERVWCDRFESMVTIKKITSCKNPLYHVQTNNEYGETMEIVNESELSKEPPGKIVGVDFGEKGKPTSMIVCGSRIAGKTTLYNNFYEQYLKGTENDIRKLYGVRPSQWWADEIIKPIKKETIKMKVKNFFGIDKDKRAIMEAFLTPDGQLNVCNERFVQWFLETFGEDKRLIELAHEELKKDE